MMILRFGMKILKSSSLSCDDGYNAVIGNTWSIQSEENGLFKILE